MTREEISSEYEKRLPLFKRCIDNLVQALEIFLQENNILYLSVTGRIKEFDSFIEKINRKKYSDPFQQNEDFCGIRIIVYYQRDIQKIQEIIDREFDILEATVKSEQLAVNEFGYRSNHSIVKINDGWLAAPNYRGLREIKIEIQIRTILMHTWAEVEHKLAYKNKDQVPKELQRQLSILSAKFEESDDQFQKLKDDIEQYRDDIKLSVESHGIVPEKSELNYDSLVALLDYYLRGYPRNKSNATNLLNRLNAEQLSIEDVEELLKKIQPYVSSLNDAVFPNRNLHLTQATILSYAVDIFSSYDANSMYTDSRMKIVEDFRSRIKET